MLATPEIEGRLPYVTASLIVTIFGTWLAVKAVRTRAFELFADIVLFLCTTAVAGFLVGVLFGEGIVTTQLVPILIYAAVAVIALTGVILFVIILLGSRSRSKVTAGYRERERGIIVSARQPSSYSERTKSA
jgi:hypothetical protein